MDHKEVKESVLAGKTLDLELVPSKYRPIVLSTWEINPNERPSFEKILKLLESKREELTYSFVEE